MDSQVTSFQRTGLQTNEGSEEIGPDTQHKESHYAQETVFSVWSRKSIAMPSIRLHSFCCLNFIFVLPGQISSVAECWAPNCESLGSNSSHGGRQASREYELLTILAPTPLTSPTRRRPLIYDGQVPEQSTTKFKVEKSRNNAPRLTHADEHPRSWLLHYNCQYSAQGFLVDQAAEFADHHTQDVSFSQSYGTSV